MQISLSGPDITEKEIQAVVDVLKTPNLSLGPKLPEFEQAFEDYIGVKRAVAVNSGTSGLFLVLKALDIGPGDEVITTPFTFIATATTIMMTGAKPVFADIDPQTMNLDYRQITVAVTNKTKAVMPVEVFGNPADFDKVCQVAKENNLPIVEDCCEALGSALNGQKAGTFGEAGVFAFYPNKQITTGEGGMIVTDSDQIADLCVSMRNQGRGSAGTWLAHERLGYNYRLSDINCALGIVQMSRIEEIVARRQQVASWYMQMLADEDRIVLPPYPENGRMSWFVFVIRMAENYTREHRDTLLQQMRDRGIQVSNYFTPVHLQPFIAEQLGLQKGDFPVTESISERTIALPFFNKLSKDDVQAVCKNLGEILDGLS